MNDAVVLLARFIVGWIHGNDARVHQFHELEHRLIARTIHGWRSDNRKRIGRVFSKLTLPRKLALAVNRNRPLRFGLKLRLCRMGWPRRCHTADINKALEAWIHLGSRFCEKPSSCTIMTEEIL